MALDIKVQPRPPESAGNLAIELEKMFTEDWGGPKSALALAYLRDTVIPDLVHCLKTNWQYLDNPTFREILISKLNSQFAYPPTFAEGLTGDILLCAKAVLGKSPLSNNHPWQPWEIILRMLTIGHRLPEIAQRTGYPEAYLEKFRKQYYKFQQVIEGLADVSEEQLVNHKELAGLTVSQIRLLIDFQHRFKVFKNYYERLQAEQIIMDLGLELDPDGLIRLFEGLFSVERQVTIQRFADILKGAKTPWLTGESYFTKTCAYSLLAHWPRKQIITLLDRLMEANLLMDDTGPEQGLTLSEGAAKLIVPLVVPKLADEVQNILRSKAKDRISRTLAVLQGRNSEITIQVIRELVRRKDTSVVMCFKALQRRVPKKVFLQIIWACGQLGGKDAVNLLSKTINDRDSLVRVRTCQAMGEMADQSFYFALISALSDPVALVRENAIRALGQLKMVSALKHMERIITNPAEDPQVQRAARETKAILQKQKDI
ncbi:HEAT repeat domain-containing protein [Desulfotomaculum nigrificans]|uniref:HEAT repeat domain-containing protein n=1 Tax=Desulfotomaculum nigrificans TaxID=1565 RepID=UPI0001FAEA0B|nr:HEAT repeat domain-containing protein [Desulfotomaculum nigrificans]